MSFRAIQYSLVMKDEKPLIVAPVLSREDSMALRDKGPDYVIYDLEDPKSLINMVPDSLKAAMMELGPKWRYLSERQIHKECDPDPIDGRLRISFWDEYIRARDSNTAFQVRNVVRNITSQDYWDTKVVLCPNKVAYMVIPPKCLIASMRSLLDRSHDRLAEVLELPITGIKYGRDGKPYETVDNALIGHMLKIVEMLKNRVQGSVIQKNFNVNYENSPGGGKVLTLEQVEAYLKETQSKIKKVGRVEKIEEGEIVE